jgi:RND family efflux transporter MFP subunit
MSESSSTNSTDLDRLRIRSAQRRPPRRRRRWPWILLGLVVLLIVLSVLMRPPQVAVVAARMGGGGPAETGGPILAANGYVEARRQASVAARTTGRLAEVLVEEGDPVDSNAVVARLLDQDQRAALAQAEANVAQARALLEQARANEADAGRKERRRAQLVADKQISDEANETALTAFEMAKSGRIAAEAGVKVAQAMQNAAALELDKTRITAPFAGVVLRKDAEVGEIVGPIMTSSTARAGAVVTIADMKTLEAGVDINESYIARLSGTTPADIVLDAYPEVHFPGEIRAIYPSADRDKATIPVRVRFLANDARIRPDLGLKVTFLERRPTTEVVTVRRSLRIPASSVAPRGKQQGVWVVREGKVRTVTPQLGEKTGDEFEVVSGISEGDQVVVNGSTRLHAGMRVRPATAGAK